MITRRLQQITNKEKDVLSLSLFLYNSTSLWYECDKACRAQHLISGSLNYTGRVAFTEWMREKERNKRTVALAGCRREWERNKNSGGIKHSGETNCLLRWSAQVETCTRDSLIALKPADNGTDDWISAYGWPLLSISLSLSLSCTLCGLNARV